jgi:hypothetical protein
VLCELFKFKNESSAGLAVRENIDIKESRKRARNIKKIIPAIPEDAATIATTRKINACMSIFNSFCSYPQIHEVYFILVQTN